MEEEKKKRVVKKKVELYRMNPFPKVVMPRYKILLLGKNYYIYDYKKYDVVKDENGVVVTAPEFSYYRTSPQNSKLEEIYEELVRIDIADQMNTIILREQNEARKIGIIRIPKKSDVSLHNTETNLHNEENLKGESYGKDKSIME